MPKSKNQKIHCSFILGTGGRTRVVAARSASIDRRPPARPRLTGLMDITDGILPLIALLLVLIIWAHGTDQLRSATPRIARLWGACSWLVLLVTCMSVFSVMLGGHEFMTKIISYFAVGAGFALAKSSLEDIIAGTILLSKTRIAQPGARISLWTLASRDKGESERGPALAGPRGAIYGQCLLHGIVRSVDLLDVEISIGPKTHVFIANSILRQHIMNIVVEGEDEGESEAEAEAEDAGVGVGVGVGVGAGVGAGAGAGAGAC